MKFLLNYHQILLFFLLIPLLIHLLKRMQAKQIMVSSLYLLRRKKANLSQKLKSCVKLKSGAKILLHKVAKPEAYGVAKIDKKNKVIGIKEKPKNFFSDLAITGLYFFDKKVSEYAKKLKPSKRGELEITDLIKKYQSLRQLKADYIGRGGAWLDTGSIEDFYKTSAFVSAIENRQGLKIACLEEISLNKKWIKKKQIVDSIKFYGNCEYSNYLKKLIT